MDGQTILGIHALAQCKDERILNVSLSAAPLHDSEGKCAGVVLNLLDTTDRAQAEESLRRNEFLFRATFDQAAVGMNYTAVDGRYLRVNDRYCEITGDSRDELLQLRYQDITYPDDLARSDRNNQELLCEQMATTSETKRYIRKDGSVVWVQVMVSLLRSESGEPLHFVGVIDDVTERIRAQEALRHSEDRFRRVVESAPEGILVERDLQILYVNPAAMSLFGASSMTELEGRSLLDLISPQDRDTAEERSARVGMHMAVPPLERTYLRLDRSPLWVEVSAAPIQYDQQIASLVFLRDITQRKQTEAEKQRLEEQLLQAQKMESLGRLAGGVAHDFNNHLTVITGYCDMLLAQLEHGDEIREEIEEIRGAGEKAAALTQQLLAFSRKQIAERKPVNLNEPVAESRKMLCRLIGEQIEIVCEPDPELGLVSADRAQMNQVLLNLTINARDAMPSGGRITIRTANVELDREGAQKHKGVAPGRYVLLSVSDTGTGMSESTLQHVFEPFFTTKGVGVGTGLGLSTVYGIVRQSDGWIEVDSRLGEGSEFRVYLPRVAAATVNAAPAALPAVAPGGAETVLVVEDQAEVRRLAMRILKINGYNLLEAGSGPEALELCRSFTRPIELLVTDVIMPGMTGKELATRLLKLRPSMKVLYVSGYTADVMNREGVLDADVAFLPKPFTPAQLSVKVREVLGQAHAAGRILVIDDDDAVRGLLQQSLLDAGYEVQSAPDGGAGMRLMADHEFDLVVTDLIMPDQEGIETIRELQRRLPRNQDRGSVGSVGQRIPEDRRNVGGGSRHA